MVDILLIQPPIRDFYLTQKRTIPYGLAALAACLRQKGCSVALFDALATSKSKGCDPLPEMAYLTPHYGRKDGSPFALFHTYRHYGYSFQHIGNIARASDAFLVGIASLFTPYADMAVQTAETVKQQHPGCKIVLGGHHPTEMPREAFASPAVDYLIRGEGETALPLLAQALQKGTSLAGIPGLCYRHKNGTLEIAEPVITKNLGRQPMPAMDLLKWKHYRRGHRSACTITASRGCPFKCSYCAMGNSSAGVYRRRPIASVIAEMETAANRYGCAFFDFEDENLAHNRPWFKTLLDRIVQVFQEKTIELRAMNGLFPPSLDEALLPQMKKAGFRTLNLSLGSTSGRQLKRFNRPDVRRAFQRLLAPARANHLACVGYIIIGAPYQDPFQSVKDLLYLLHNRVLAGVSVFYPAPGSSDYDLCRAERLLPAHTSLYRSSALPLEHTTSRLQTVTLLRLGRIANFLLYLKESGTPLPSPEPCRRSHLSPAMDRQAMGRELLKWFLYDGNIRGVDAGGQVYLHPVSSDLTASFIAGLQA